MDRDLLQFVCPKISCADEQYSSVESFVTIKLRVVLSCCTGYPTTKGIYIALTFESEHSILKYDHSNLSYVAVLLWVKVYYAVKGVSYFLVCG